MNRVDILLATYNGASFIQEQVRSILEQTHRDFHLFIRDDGSKDETLKIIECLKNQNPDVITLLPFKENLGVKRNFSELLCHSTAPYSMFCDQDDIWMPQKIEKTLAEMKKLEAKYGAHSPLLVHTDLELVNQDGSPLAPSFWKYAALNPSYTQLHYLLMQNNVTGNTMLMNRALTDLAMPIPAECVMHDWWVALVAAAFGRIEPFHQQTILYRQHQNNQVGAKRYSLNALFKKHSSLTSRFHQAEVFAKKYQHRLNPKQNEMLKAFYTLPLQGYLKQKQTLIKHSFYKQSFLRNLYNFLIKI